MRKWLPLAAVAGLLVASAPAASAQMAGGGASGFTPGHMMHSQGRVSGSPGASRFAPGHQMQRFGSVPG